MFDSMTAIDVTFVGRNPLLMHNCTGVNPFNELTKEQKKITSKRKKTDEDLIRLAEIDWQLGIYYDEVAQTPYIPSNMIQACIREGAKTFKKGKAVIEGAILVDPAIRTPLQYPGPKEYDKLFRNPEFQDGRTVKVQSSRVSRVRPRFNNWKIDVTVYFDPAMMDYDEVVQILRVAGARKGIGDYREQYGRFDVVINTPNPKAA